PIDLEIRRRHRRTILLDLNLEAVAGQLQSPLTGFSDRDGQLSKFTFHQLRVPGLPLRGKAEPARSCQILLDALLQPAYKPGEGPPMKLVQKRSKKTGLPPGTLVHIGERRPDKTSLQVFHYNAGGCQEFQPSPMDQLSQPDEKSVMWVNVGGVHHIEVLETLGKQFILHPLLLEDVANTDQRPKLDDYESYLFFVVKMLLLTERKEIAIEQGS